MTAVSHHMTAAPKLRAPFAGLETFTCPKHLQAVQFETEFTTFDPEGEAQYYKVRVRYIPLRICVRQSTVAEYFNLFRNRSETCERLACEIAADFREALRCTQVDVVLKKLGSIDVTAEAMTLSPPRPE